MDEGRDIATKRVFTRSGATTTLLVAAGIGLVSVSVAADRIGEFGVIRRCSPQAIAAGSNTLALATDADVVVNEGAAFTETGFGPAVAVGIDGADGPVQVHAVAPDGRLGRYHDGQWDDRGTIDAAVRTIDGDLVATADGVVRLADGRSGVGLSDVRDVAAAGRPLAATSDGLYSLGNGWMRVLEGPFRTVASDGTRAHAATADRLFARTEGTWDPIDVPVDEPIVAFAYGRHVSAITTAGTLLLDAGEGVRAHALGLDDVVGLAAAPEPNGNRFNDPQ